MSKKSAEEFLNKLEKDADFRFKLLKAKSLKERRKILADANFDFTEKEVLEVLEKTRHIHIKPEQLKQSKQFDSLSDKELRKVAAGSFRDVLSGLVGH